ncbi:MAG: carbohydrate-binding domain-containing protein [Clostridiaceae bacterium]
MKKKIITMLIVLSLSAGLAGCKSASTTSADSTSGTSNTAITNAQVLSSINVSSGESESVGEAGTFIELGSTITVNGSGATVDKNKVTITAAGSYSIKGSLTDGQIIVNAGDSDKVYIILNGVNITCSDSAPIYVMNSKKIIISLADNTNNTITAAAAATENEPDAAIFSKADLDFIGKGSLNVQSSNNSGIVSKDDLKIENGNITVKAAGDGIKGKDTVVITNGNITVNADKDGIQSNNDTDAEKGYVLIEGGKINITAGQDGIQGEISTLIKNGDITINTGGGSQNGTSNAGVNQGGPGNSGQSNSQSASSEETTSAKAVKAAVNVVIEGGTFNIDSSDDAFHSNNNLVISGGTFNISAGDDGLHSDSTLTINNGTVDIKKSYEGIESKTITFKDGDINVVSSDDGINASAGSDSSSTNGRQGQGDDGSIMNINGGNITVNAAGDGIDSNGSIKMTAGKVIVNGPTDNGNGALDYNGTFDLTGGTLVAAGSSGMAEAPSSSSTQNSVKINLANQSAGTIVHIVSSDGEEVVTFAPSKQYSSFVISSSKLENGKTYKVYVGGSSTSTPTEGVYAEGTYTKSTEAGSFTISGTVTEMTQDGASNTGNMRGPGGK